MPKLRYSLISAPIDQPASLVSESPFVHLLECRLLSGGALVAPRAPTFRGTAPSVLSAPQRTQVLTEVKYKGNAADVWSLGVMLYVMIEGAFPFRLRHQRHQMQKMIGRIVNADYKRPTHVRAGWFPAPSRLRSRSPWLVPGAV